MNKVYMHKCILSIDDLEAFKASCQYGDRPIRARPGTGQRWIGQPRLHRAPTAWAFGFVSDVLRGLCAGDVGPLDQDCELVSIRHFSARLNCTCAYLISLGRLEQSRGPSAPGSQSIRRGELQCIRSHPSCLVQSLQRIDLAGKLLRLLPLVCRCWT